MYFDPPIPPVTGKRVLRFQVAYELLKEAMNMPENCKIIAIIGEKYHRECDVIVVSEDFPESEEGAFIQQISPMITTAENDCGHRDVEWNWRIPSREDVEEYDDGR